MKKIILDLCGGTGAWSKPYKDAGYKIYNITTPEYDVRKHAFIKDELIFPKENGMTLCLKIDDIYGILAAPPCTMFSVARTTAKYPRDLRAGMELVEACLRIIWGCQYNIKSNTQRKAPLKFWCLENPRDLLEWFLGKPAFTFDPYEFGDGYSKKTCLWGCFNQPKKLEKYERIYRKKFDKLLRKDLEKIRSIGDICFKDTRTRKTLRAITPAGFAKAFFEVNSEEVRNGN